MVEDLRKGTSEKILGSRTPLRQYLENIFASVGQKAGEVYSFGDPLEGGSKNKLQLNLLIGSTAFLV